MIKFNESEDYYQSNRHPQAFYLLTKYSSSCFIQYKEIFTTHNSSWLKLIDSFVM